MHSRRLRYLFVVVLALATAVVGCELPFGGQPEEPPPTNTPTLPSIIVQSPTDTPMPPTEAPPTPEPTPTNTPAPVHVEWPDGPTEPNTFVTDPSTKGYADKRNAIADLFLNNIYERPYTREVMDYLGHLDIKRVELQVGGKWVYAIFFLEGEPPVGSTATYAIEIDKDEDERGDWLIVGVVPPSSEWTTDGVRVYQDSNEDVGGLTPMLSDEPVEDDDGYDDLVFDQGYGEDPDAAWIRRDPDNPTRVQLAFKYDIINRDKRFYWGGVAEEGENLPAWFDFNDHLTLEDAGSPFKKSIYYPVQGLSAVDSTCRYTYGFDPPGGYAGLCGAACEPGLGFLYCPERTTHWVPCQCLAACPPGYSCPPCVLNPCR